MKKRTIQKFLTAAILLIAFGLNAQNYKITFYANHPFNAGETNSLPGHVWVGFYDGTSTRFWGFYTDGLRDDSHRRPDISYGYSVKEDQYKAAVRVIAAYISKEYSIGSDDCRFFAASVAETIGLNVPVIGKKSPAEWLADLVDAN